MLVVGPQTLTVGQVNPIVDPARTGNPSVAVQIQNSSPYQLSILADGDGYSIQPFFAQTIPVAGGVPIQITPLAQAGLSAACSVTLTFLLAVARGSGVLLPDGVTWVEPPPQQDGPLTAAAIASALSTQASIDVLLPPTSESTGSGVVALPLTSLHAYNAVIVQATPTASKPCYATVTNSQGQTFGAAMLLSANSSGDYQAVVPCANVAGSSLTVSIYFLAPAGGALISVQGSTSSPVPSMRSDGRAYPAGAFFQTGFALGAVNTTVIAAPAVTLQRILLASGWFQSTGATGGPTVTINGASVLLNSAVAAWFGTLPIPPNEGLLLDANTAVVLQGGAGNNIAASFSYDLVV